MRRLRQLEEENRRLKGIVADQALDLRALKDALAKNGTARSEAQAGGGSDERASSVAASRRRVERNYTTQLAPDAGAGSQSRSAATAANAGRGAAARGLPDAVSGNPPRGI